ncbi:uncharacterized protein LOC112504742 [Cynara cardunculus var. scolymus]|uniref:uncharacterized protein LOC112504742 n=1 Tax=Cynara cardunculus var. scolymus TaxID=59895 RepID=UPI000D62A44D|nr:uncharacterized protein LOC112504742 [Cynara cardunculus var. scolymus]
MVGRLMLGRILGYPVVIEAFISYRFIHSCGFSTATTVRELVLRLDGVWPDEWRTRFAEICSAPLPLLNDSVCDYVLWGDTSASCSKFSVSNAWASLEGTYPVVPWYKSVWFSGHIPKHAFCLWLACHKRLPTQDRMLWKDESSDLKCSLCGLFIYSHSHFFFQCNFAHEVWDSILHRVDLTTMPSSWDHILEAISDTGRRPKRLKQKLAVAASVYYIWQERNRRLFSEDRWTSMQLIKIIDHTIATRAA